MSKPSTIVHHVLTFPGDGIGPEVVRAAQIVVAATGVEIHWETMEAGYESRHLYGGSPMTEEHLAAFEAYRTLFKGPQTIPPGEDYYTALRQRKYTSPNQALRQIFDLYANLRLAPKTFGAQTRFPEVDLIVIRENTEDLYIGQERRVDQDTVEATKRTTRRASRRIANFAYRYAQRARKNRITIVHKANVLKQSDGLFLHECRAVAEGFPEIATDDQLCDSLLTKLVTIPEGFEILLCQNLFGDLLSDLAAGLVGGLGLCPSANFGDGYTLFEPCHGSAPDIAGLGVANPTAQIRCAIMLLEHLGEATAAGRVERALDRVIAEGIFTTPDLGGTAGTQDMAQEVADLVIDQGRADEEG